MPYQRGERPQRLPAVADRLNPPAATAAIRCWHRKRQSAVSPIATSWPSAVCGSSSIASTAAVGSGSVAGRRSRWTPAIMQRTDPPASSIVGMSTATISQDCSIAATWSGRRLRRARRSRPAFVEEHPHREHQLLLRRAGVGNLGGSASQVPRPVGPRAGGIDGVPVRVVGGHRVPVAVLLPPAPHDAGGEHCYPDDGAQSAHLDEGPPSARVTADGHLAAGRRRGATRRSPRIVDVRAWCRPWIGSRSGSPKRPPVTGSGRRSCGRQFECRSSRC